MSDSTPTLERVARAIFIARSWQTARVGDWDDADEVEREPYYKLARAALDASGNDERWNALKHDFDRLADRENFYLNESERFRDALIRISNAPSLEEADGIARAAIARTQEQSE